MTISKRHRHLNNTMCLTLIALSALLTIPAFCADIFQGGRLDRDQVIKESASVTRERYPNADDVMVDEFHAFLAGREKLPEYLEVYELTLTPELLGDEDEYVRQGLRRELMRLKFGQQAAYEVGIEDDLQLQETLALFKQARTTAELLAVAAEWEAERIANADAEGETEVH